MMPKLCSMYSVRTHSERRILEATALVAMVAFSGDAALAADTPLTSTLEEVVVTANRRAEQSINDVPLAITAVTAEEIQQRGLAGMADYLTTLPGVSFLDVGYTSNNIIIRGLDTNPAGTTRPSLTGMYFGETSLSGLSGLSSVSNPDVQLVDIERIELLSGPQGTLYGDASMAGALRIIPAKPDTSAFSAGVSALYSVTDNADGGNYDVQGVLNVPLIQDTLALRVVGYRNDYDGYIKNVAGENPEKLATAAVWGGSTPVKKVNDREYTGGRVALRWDATDALSLTLTHLQQEFDQDGGSQVILGLGDGLQQNNFGGETSSNELSLTNLELSYDWSWASLISSTAWVDSKTAANTDVGTFVGPAFGVADLPVFQRYRYRNTAFTQEARLVSRTPGKLQWLVGAFYQDKELGGDGGNDDRSLDVDWVGNPASDPLAGAEIFAYTSENQTKQKALFGELSYELVKGLTATVGTRFYKYEKEDHIVQAGVFAGGGSTTRVNNDDDGSTNKVNLAYEPSENALFFATYSEGFRLGGPHTPLPTTCDADSDGLIDGLGIPFPTQVDSDQTKNYEVGSKLTLLDRRLQVNATVFNIKWEGIPTDVTASCLLPVTINAGEARSRGVELSGEIALAQFRASYAFSYIDAELTKDSPPAGFDGDRLPGSPRVNGTIGLRYDFPLAGHDAFVRTDVGYVGEYYYDLLQSSPRLGDYTTIGFRTGLAFSNLNVELFGQNLTNKYAVTWFNPGVGVGNVLRPRTIGLRLRYDFGQ